MQTIMEPVFEIAYLIGVITLGALTLRAASGRRQYMLLGIMAIVLGAGDAFHLVPRIYALLTGGLENHVAALGFGTFITSITMTVFYVILYHVWQLRYGKGKMPALTALVYGLAISRIALCMFPHNRWLSPDAPLAWGIYRNIPFAMLGILAIALFFKEARGSNDRAFRFMWLAIALSFALYFPVVLFSDIIPALGLLMIPKTCAYVWMVWMGYADARSAPLNVNG